MEVTKQDDAWHSDALAIGKNGQEASRALLDERCFPVLVQHVELVGWDAAGDTARASINGVGRAYRNNSGGP